MADLSLPEVIETHTDNLKQHYLRRNTLYNAVDTVSFVSTSFISKMLIRNPSGSGVNAILFDISAYLVLGATTSQLNQINMRVRKNPTVTTVGTAMVEHNMSVDQADAPNVQITKSPTISATGTIMYRKVGINTPIHVEPLILAPGEDLLIQLAVNTTANTAYIQVTFAEDDE